MSKLKYKDSNGVWQPIAPSQKEFDDFKDSTMSDLAERALQTDVDNALSLKRDKATLLTQSDCATSLLQQIAGTAPVLAAQPYDTTIGKNIFDKTKVTMGYYVSKDDGNLVSSTTYNISDWIIIQPNTQYYRVEYGGQFAFYDANKNFISGGWQTHTFTTPSNAFYLRSSVSNTTGVDKEQIEIGSVGTSYTPYNFSLPKLQINNSNMSPYSVAKSNLNFTPAELKVGKNLFDKSTITAGYYVDQTTGNLSANSNYNASDWIPIKPSTQYVKKNGTQYALYDNNKTYISGGIATTFTTPSNAAYIRISATKANLSTEQLELGSTSTSYEDFNYVIDKLKPTTILDYFDLILPKEMCVAVGRTMELYNKQVCHCGNINNYHFSWSCDIGSSMKRKWTVTATSAMIGNHTLTLNVYDNNLNLVVTGTITIKIVNISTPINTTKNVLPMGDSLTSSKPWLNEWKSLSDSMFGTGKLQFIGTQGTDPYKNEGYSGWSTNNFSTNFVSQIILTVSGVTTPPSSKKNYSVPDTQGSYTWNIESCNIDGSGNGTITLNINAGVTRTPLSSGTITATDGAGTGDSSVAYSSYVVGKSNPFWNASTSQLDFNNYLSVNSLTKPDIVQIFLGANELAGIIGGYNAILSAQQSTINNMKTIIDTILSQWAGTKIYIVLTPFYADQNGLGKNYGSTNNRNELQTHMNVFTLAKAMMSQFNDYNSAVTVVPVAQTMDSDYAYTPVQQAVNPRSAVTELVQTGMVHPSNEGYYQMADTMFSHFVGHYLDA